MSGRAFLRRLVGVPEPPPKTRLTTGQAVSLAAAAPGVRALGRDLMMASPRVEEDRVLWRVSSGGVGAQWWVEVDDATGAVGPVHHAHGR